MSLLEVGPEKFKIWVHRGSQLDKCTALRLDYSFLKLLFARMKKFGWEFGQHMKDGKLQMHGE